MHKGYLTIFILLFYTQVVDAQILPTFGDSRTGGSGMQFLKISPDAKALSMGGTGVSVSNDLSSIYWNPAGITSMDWRMGWVRRISGSRGRWGVVRLRWRWRRASKFDAVKQGRADWYRCSGQGLGLGRKKFLDIGYRILDMGAFSLPIFDIRVTATLFAEVWKFFF